MTDIFRHEKEIKLIIDELKALCSQNGLSNQASEEVIITSVFLYKFLNDKFMYNMDEFLKEASKAKNKEYTKEDVFNNVDNLLKAFQYKYSNDVFFNKEETIEYLGNKTGDSKFYELFDNALESISKNPVNADFQIETADGGRKPLFTRITEYIEMNVNDSNKGNSGNRRNNFAKNIFTIISTERIDFKEIFKENFDFYSSIFEYLIKDYNVASGVYAEYFTPQAVSSIIGNILANMSPLTPTKSYDIYDPSAGSGSLVLHLANALSKRGKYKNSIYTQDISQKSSRFLRLNMMINGLKESIGNIIEGDTLLNPAHYVVPNDSSSGIKQFDFITSNPPFKMDFSSTSEDIRTKWEESDEHDGLRRFFAGVPKVPKNKKESMAIYLCFIQHILWSLRSDGKAAIVVPTGFLTAKTKIEHTIRETIIDKHWLKGVISMPSNIFANTGTNVSIIFIDKANADGEIILINASELGKKVKDGKNQRTVLSEEEITKIEQAFVNQNEIENFSVKVSYDQIKEKDYSFSAGQYFEIKPEYVEITTEEFEHIMKEHKISLSKKLKEAEESNKEIINQLGGFKYEH